MACLDTSFVIDLMREQKRRAKGPASFKLLDLQRRGELLSTTLFTAAELFAGISSAPEPQKDMQRVENILELLNILPFDMSSTKLFGLIYSELRRLGIGIGAIDSLIASVVMENDETLITRNIRHFSRVPGLKVESY